MFWFGIYQTWLCFNRSLCSSFFNTLFMRWKSDILQELSSLHLMGGISNLLVVKSVLLTSVASSLQFYFLSSDVKCLTCSMVLRYALRLSTNPCSSYYKHIAALTWFLSRVWLHLLVTYWKSDLALSSLSIEPSYLCLQRLKGTCLFFLSSILVLSSGIKSSLKSCVFQAINYANGCKPSNVMLNCLEHTSQQCFVDLPCRCEKTRKLQMSVVINF